MRNFDSPPWIAWGAFLALASLSIGCHGSSVADRQKEIRPLPAAAPIRQVVRPHGGAQTDGGLAGTLLRVTSLADRGPGSLRAAVEANHPRLVVFEVGGIIDLQGRTLVVRNPHLTIAGQTAPDPGITIIRGGIVIETHDVVIQHLAVRPGDRGNPDREWAPDALSVRRGSSGPAHDIVFEHCSATWAVDENLSTSGPADAAPEQTASGITIRHCLVAEALSASTHPKGEHSKGTLIHDGVRNVAILGSVYAHNRDRNPRLKGGTTASVLETVIYNWGSAAVALGSRGAEKILAPAEAVLAGNLVIAGPDTRSRVFVKGYDEGGRVFLGQNLLIGAKLKDDRVVAGDASVSTAAPRQAAEIALRRAGARPARRDPIDARIIRSIIEGTGRIIDSQEEVGGYPVREATKRALTVPEDIDERRQWLEKLSNELAEDRSLDVEPLSRRLPSEASTSP